MTNLAISPADVQVPQTVQTVGEYFEQAVALQADRTALAMFAAFVIALDEQGGSLEIQADEFLALKDHELAIYNSRPGVIKFLLAAPEADNEAN
jgi:hypothetical protein